MRAICRCFSSLTATPAGAEIPASSCGCLPLLSSCRNLKSVLRIHGRLVVSGISHGNSTLTHLISAYGMHQKLDSARVIFDSVTNPGAILYNSMIRAYTRSYQHNEALKLYHKMLERGTEPDKYTYTFVLKACAGKLELEEGVEVHNDVIRRGLESDVFIATELVDMYCKMGQLDCAREVFDKMPKRDIVSWNAMIGGLSQGANPDESLVFFQAMQLDGLVPSSVSLLNLFPALCKLEDGRLSKSVHGFVIRQDFQEKVFNGLIDVYSKCGLVEDARRVFDRMRGRDHVSWGTMMAGYAHNGYFDEVLELFDGMKSNNMVMNKVSAISSALAASEMRDLDKGNEIHNCVMQHCIGSNIIVATALMTMYIKCGETDKAKQIFSCLKEKDLVAWSALIAAFVQSGFPQQALSLFREMVYEKLKPSSITLLSVFPACTELSLWNLGKSIHSYSLKAGIGSEVAIGNTLISMYAKCGRFTQALAIFHNLPSRNVVSWNALINGYAENGDAFHALEMFQELLSSGSKPDLGTMASVVSACALLHGLDQGACTHGLIIKSGFISECHVKNALIDMYAKCRVLEYAESLFNETEFTRDQVSWNALIAGYVHNRYPKGAISAFCQMRSEDFQPSAASFVSVLSAAVDLIALREGMALHACIVHMGFQSHTPVGNSLIDMYAKCGRFDFAEKYFDEMGYKDIVSWNTMLAGCAVHGHATRAVALFLQMQDNTVMVDGVSFLSVLSACRHSGLIEEGRKIFHSMRDNFHVEPKLEHFACMVDLLGRTGLFTEIMDLINEMPMEPDASIWGALLGACRMHSNIELAEEVLSYLVRLEPRNPAHYVGLSNIYAQFGRWVEAKNTRLKLTNAGMKKTPGNSWV